MTLLDLNFLDYSPPNQYYSSLLFIFNFFYTLNLRVLNVLLDNLGVEFEHLFIYFLCLWIFDELNPICGFFFFFFTVLFNLFELHCLSNGLTGYSQLD